MPATSRWPHCTPAERTVEKKCTAVFIFYLFGIDFVIGVLFFFYIFITVAVLLLPFFLFVTDPITNF